MTKIYSALQKEEQIRGGLKNEHTQLKLSLDMIKSKIVSTEENLSKKKSTLGKVTRLVEELNDKMNILRDELKTPFTSSLSEAETAEIDSLNESISQIQNSLAILITEKSNVEVEVKKIENSLKNNYEKRKAELEELIGSDVSADTDDIVYYLLAYIVTLET